MSSSSTSLRVHMNSQPLRTPQRWYAASAASAIMGLTIAIMLLNLVVPNAPQERSSSSSHDRSSPMDGERVRLLRPPALSSPAICSLQGHDAPPTIVLCIGDSITYGNGSDTAPSGKIKPLRGNYPVVLQQRLNDACSGLFTAASMLGMEQRHSGGSTSGRRHQQRFAVANLGKSGTTLMDGTALSYRNSSEYRKAMVQIPLKAVRIVIIMIGTNDSKQWRGSLSTLAFEDALVAFVQRLSALRSDEGKVEVVIVAPPPALPTPRGLQLGQCRVAFDVQPHFIRGAINQACASAAKRINARFLDLYHALTAASDSVAVEIQRLATAYPNCSSTVVGHRSVAARMHDATSIARFYEDGLHPTALLSDKIAGIVSAYLLQSF